MRLPPRSRRGVAALASLLVCPGLAWAFAVYPDRLPNGSVNTCLNCHQRNTGGGPLNPFGAAVRALPGGIPDWSLLYDGDADEDGFSNGEELGDPCGEWSRGGPPPPFTTGITLPGDDASVPDAHTLDRCSDAGGSSSSSSSSSSSGGSSSLEPDAGGTASSSSRGASSTSQEGSSSSGGCASGPLRGTSFPLLTALPLVVVALRRMRARSRTA
ncbi:MAG: hypothetical protein AB2A00_09790 [Myxococcota bacterium]